jgi:hypothetical protein
MGAAINVGEVYAYLVRDLHAGTYSTPGFEHALRNARLIAAVSRAAARGERQRVLGTDRTLRPDESNDPLVSSLRTSGDLFTHILRVVDIRAMVFDHYSEPDVIRMRDAPVPEPHEGEEFIRGRLCRHQSIRLESTLGPERTMPGRVDLRFVTGLNAAGVVERTGSNVTGWNLPKIRTWASAQR